MPMPVTTRYGLSMGVMCGALPRRTTRSSRADRPLEDVGEEVLLVVVAQIPLEDVGEEICGLLREHQRLLRHTRQLRVSQALMMAASPVEQWRGSGGVVEEQ